MLKNKTICIGKYVGAIAHSELKNIVEQILLNSLLPTYCTFINVQILSILLQPYSTIFITIYIFGPHTNFGNVTRAASLNVIIWLIIEEEEIQEGKLLIYFIIYFTIHKY